MVFALLTLLAALSLATVAGWFSIIGMMAIFAGAPMHALILGVVVEAGKLVTTSWIYRNWQQSDWKLKIPLIAATIIVMLVTSIGVFGFLSKAHLEQGASTVDNGAKVERLDQQIAREKSIIADNEKVIAQLDATINSYLGKDRADRSVTIRRSQAPQRKQLRDDIDAAQKRIDALSDEKFALESEVRKLELEVGPIRYISELMYGTEDTNKNVESAVRIFTLLIVLTLDPLAIILLIAANHTLLRLQNEKKNKAEEEKHSGQVSAQHQSQVDAPASTVSSQHVQVTDEKIYDIPPDESSDRPGHLQETQIHAEIPKDTVGAIEIKETEPAPVEVAIAESTIIDTPPIIQPVVEPVKIKEVKETVPWMSQSHILSELLGNHNITEKPHEEEKIAIISQVSKEPVPEAETIHNSTTTSQGSNSEASGANVWDSKNTRPPEDIQSKTASPVVLSWLNEFKGNTK